MTEKARLIELIMNAPKLVIKVGGRAQGKTYQTAHNLADHLLANGVMLIDTNTVDVVTNREPLQTAFGMPLNELAELIKAKQEGRIIVKPKEKPKAIYKNFCSHSCEAFYLCPICNEVFGTWSIDMKDVRCPHCKTELGGIR